MCVYVCVCVLSRLSCVQLSVTLWTIACQAPLSVEFSRQEYWSGALLQEVFPTQGLNPSVLCLQHRQVGSLPLTLRGKTVCVCVYLNHFALQQ